MAISSINSLSLAGAGGLAKVDTYALAAPTITTLGTDTIYTFTQDGATVLVLTVPVQATVSTLGRGLFGGGYTGAYSNVIDFVTIATAGNATDFGDLTVARHSLAGCSSTTRGLFGAASNVIDFVTIATAGNAADFGDLTVARQYLAACSSTTRGLFGGGNTGAVSNVIDFVTIATTGNATDFGDLTVARYGLAGLSNSHGGLI